MTFSLSIDTIFLSHFTSSYTLRNEKTDASVINEELYLNAIEPYAHYYRSHGIYMELYADGKLIFSNGPAATEEQRPELMAAGVVSVTRRIKGRKYLITAGPVPDYSNLTLVHIRAMDGLEAIKENLIRVFLWVSTIVCLILALAIFLLLKGLTRPIEALNRAVARISQGDYHERIQMCRRDELGELAQNFNTMAQAIEDHTKALTRVAEEKQRFIDNLAHELRTPLTSIRGYAEYIENAHCTEEERIKAAGHLSKAVTRLQNLAFKHLNITYLIKATQKKDGTIWVIVDPDTANKVNDDEKINKGNLGILVVQPEKNEE